MVVGKEEQKRKKKERQSLYTLTPDHPPLRPEYQLLIIISNYLRELLYDRNPGDACVKVGSDREFASRLVAPNSGVDEIGY